MTKSLETLRADLAKVRTGRAHTGILDHIMVDYYGSPTALTQVANVTLIDARTIGVQPYEKKMANTIEKAIRDADLGLNPSAQGDMIRVPTPPLTEERRKEMVKLVKSEAEDAKIAVRNIRRDAQRIAEEAGQGQGLLRGRRAPLVGRSAEADRQVHCRHRQDGGRQRKRSADGLVFSPSDTARESMAFPGSAIWRIIVIFYFWYSCFHDLFEFDNSST